jgi:hypothetical protein
VYADPPAMPALWYREGIRSAVDRHERPAGWGTHEAGSDDAAADEATRDAAAEGVTHGAAGHGGAGHGGAGQGVGRRDG